MRIAIFGKYPPIQGGVSSDVFEFASAATTAGHDVHVFTNASETEVGLRIVFNDSDIAFMAMPASQVHVHTTTALHQKYYVPYANPYLSKLLGLGIAAFKRIKFDVVLGWYLEPYALCAAILAQMFNVPLYVRTAGSDVGKLAAHPNLRESYRLVFESAAIVLGGRPNSETNRVATDLGANPNTFVFPRPNSLPPEFLARSRVSLQLDWQSELLRLRELVPDEIDLLTHYIQLNQPNSIDLALPTIGLYGKVGETKGSFDVLAACLDLSRSGHRFNLLWAVAGTSPVVSQVLKAISLFKDVHANVVVVPPIAPWNVPRFLDICDIVCVVERKFPVTFHSPRLPREVLARGACLVVSAEVAAKQLFAQNLVHSKNCVIVDDPSDGVTLRDVLSRLISNTNEREYIAAHGKFLSETIEYFLEPGNSVLNALVDTMNESVNCHQP